jgi:hypothetical protein
MSFGETREFDVSALQGRLSTPPKVSVRPTRVLASTTFPDAGPMVRIRFPPSASQCLACASALKGDPTPSVYQGLDFSMRIPVSVGSRSAPMGTPLYCSFRRLIRVLNQTKKGSHFGTELQLCAKKASLHGKGRLCTKSLRFFERGRLATGKSFGARRHQRHRHDRDPGLPRYLNATHPVGSCGYQWLGGARGDARWRGGRGNFDRGVRPVMSLSRIQLFHGAVAPNGH